MTGIEEKGTKKMNRKKGKLERKIKGESSTEISGINHWVRKAMGLDIDVFQYSVK